MLFKPELCQAILDRQKTQTRRLVQEDEYAVNQHGRLVPDDVWGDRIDTVYSASGRVKWQVGRTYAIQPGRGKKAVGRFLLTGIREEQLQDISEENALEEGVATWGLYHKGRVSARYTFSVLWDFIYTKLNKAKSLWHNNPRVWVLEFEKVI